MRPYQILLFASVCSLLLVSCATSQPKTITTDWTQLVSTSPIFRQNHTGFALYDPEKQAMVAEYQSDRYFTPASNTKLFSLYAGLCILGDSVPALRYMTRGDSLIFWGTGDPNLLHPDMPASAVLNHLKNWGGKLYYYPHNYTGKRFGSGWSWADYDGYYQCELSALPLYGNIVRFTNRTVKPRIFKDSLRTAGWAEEFELSRDEFANNFFSRGWPAKAFEQDVPYRTSPQLAAMLLADTLKKEVRLLAKLPNVANYKTMFSIPADTMYRRMIQVSDNMLAEQIMLLCASRLDTHNVGFDIKKGIDYVKTQLLSDLPDEPIWVDGSGLSRYNLFTPRAIIKLLQKIQAKVPDQQRLFGLMSIGGKAGTIRNMFRNRPPFVFAKTGTLANTYALSGYLRTKSGKVLIFSLMNNSYTRKTAEIRAEVERILTEVYEKY
ncbi:MAG: D-alanyl-D-alanine carboxypeptidase [Spirosomaceae bacterium]|jgi:D-alanyl-D-alanine carboxypeptidase/D-alanyl-D-alanine-endopeptidase (penicillin-binding protein 4)|nr:D-alanyl-D-alanine carboxypeptidase [Spirosomataceae bacterium]